MSTVPAYTEQGAAAEFKRGPEWLAAARKAAIDHFAQLGFPTTRNEDWHFTSVTPIAERTFKPVRSDGTTLALSDLDVHTFGKPETWSRLVFVNGRYEPGLSGFAALPESVRCLTISEALKESPELVAEQLGKLATVQDQPFTALNTALMTDGVVIHVPADEVVEHPIHVLHVVDAHADGGAMYPRLLVVAGRHSRLTVVESFVGMAGTATYLTNAVAEFTVGEGAHVEHYKVQREGTEAFHVQTVQATQARSSVFHSFSFATGAALSRTNVFTRLLGDGAEARLNGLYMVDGTQHCDHQTFVEHIAPNCSSRELYKGILDGAGHGVFNGKVYVDPEAQKTDGKQSNHALLLSEHAKVDTKPQLEIFADDVKCTHGATVGRLDQMALFYLKSRGIGGENARALLTYAFGAEVLETIEQDLLREQLEELVFERFTHTHQR